MASLKKDSLGKEYLLVEKGDSLWDICSKQFPSKISGSTTQAKINTLVNLNDITNPNYIVVGQKLYISTSSANKTNTTNVARIKAFGLQSGTDRTIYATWTWTKTNTEEYQTKWWYDSGDGVWFVGNDSTTKEKQSLYSAPTNAKRVKFQVKPISRKRTVNKKETSYWTASWSTAEFYTFTEQVSELTTPNLVLVSPGDRATVTYEGLDPSIEYIQIDRYYWGMRDGAPYMPNRVANTVYTINGEVIGYSEQQVYKVEAGRVEMPVFLMYVDSPYSVRCRPINSNGLELPIDIHKLETSMTYKNGHTSDAKPAYNLGKWTAMSNLVMKRPNTPNAITVCKAALDKDGNPTAVELEWTAVWNIDNYEVEYTPDDGNFDSSQGTTTVSTPGKEAKFKITGLTSGEEYFFRVRGVREGENSAKSEWSDIVSVTLGTKPSAPTTWSSTNTAVIGDSVTLYWTHNSEDGSDQTWAKMEVYINDSSTPTEYIIEGDTSFKNISTSGYEEGAKIKWRVQTAGVTGEYSDWSETKTIDVYENPTLSLGMSNADGEFLDKITGFPFYVKAEASPNNSHQKPLSYVLSVISNEYYETVNDVGETRIVTAGSEIYSKYFDTSDDLLVEMSAGNIDLENNISYTIKCEVAMDSGLNADALSVIYVAWDEAIYEPNAEISINEDDYSASIRPYCEDATGKLFEGITLSVYRREYDGGFTLIASGIDNTNQMFVTDPHPALDYARYRIVATAVDTGAMSYYDVPGIPVGGKSIVIQWDETWSSFNAVNEGDGVIDDLLANPTRSGSILKLPYNIDSSPSYSRDVSLIEYIGRKHPVSYYGTQVGETQTLSTDIPKDDEETVYALRRLNLWSGDVYIREPSGTGYWANISITFPTKHKDVKIPVTINVKRVEGGV